MPSFMKPLVAIVPLNLSGGCPAANHDWRGARQALAGKSGSPWRMVPSVNHTCSAIFPMGIVACPMASDFLRRPEVAMSTCCNWAANLYNNARDVGLGIMLNESTHEMG